MTAKTKAIPSAQEQASRAAFATLDLYLAEVKRLLLEKGLGSKWVDALVEGDRPFLTLAFERNTLPVAAAFEVYVTEEESASEPIPEDRRLKLNVTTQAEKYLQQLVQIGLWGDSIECVAVTLIQQQLASKLEAGVFRLAIGK